MLLRGARRARSRYGLQTIGCRENPEGPRRGLVAVALDRFAVVLSQPPVVFGDSWWVGSSQIGRMALKRYKCNE